MTKLEANLVALAKKLQALNIPYMIIGGMANAHWGVARLTLDIDATIWAEDVDLGELLRVLADEFEPVHSNPVAFAEQTNVVPLKSKDETRIDMILGTMEYEREAIERAVGVVIGGQHVKFCTAEDLIVHKIFSERSRDRDDVRGVVKRRIKKLDLEYLEPKIRMVCESLSITEPWEFWLTLKKTNNL